MTDYRSVRGMVDILPEDSFLWQQLEGVMAAVLQQYGYQEIRLPIIETTQLFSRSIGEAVSYTHLTLPTSDLV